MTSDDVRDLLARIKDALGGIEAEAEQYGGWPGHDEDALIAVDLGLRLTGVAHVVGLFGREVAEGGTPVPALAPTSKTQPDKESIR